MADVTVAAPVCRLRRGRVVPSWRATRRSVARTVALRRKIVSATSNCSSGSFKAEQDLRVPHGKQILGQPRLHLLVQIEQPHGICDRRPAPAHFLRDVFLPHSEFTREPGIRLRFLDRIEIRALQIFDQRKLEHLQVGGDAGNHRHFREPCFLRRPPAAFPGDQFVPAAHLPNDQRLDDSMLANRFDQFVQGLAREIFPRLQRTRHDAGHD